MAETSTARLRRNGARAIALAGRAALEVSKRLIEADGASLEGDRTVEWSFCVGRLAPGPARTLDFGADTGFLALSAAQRGHEVLALDLLPEPLQFSHDSVRFQQADILDRPLAGDGFDQILNCSSVEHVGLPGRYGSRDVGDGDLEAMEILGEALAPRGTMILTIPVGRDLVCAPHHRIYGGNRLPRLIAGYDVVEEQYWGKDVRTRTWRKVGRDSALTTEGSASFYALGLFVLRRA